MTDEQVLAAVKERPRSATYVVKNVLRSIDRSVTTPQVLRALRRLEKLGRVREVPTSYAVMLSWEAV
ncbi:hypothetical protein OIU34_18715 [Pararhizobium sp. BT-229]|uniref:hypothetical protein n=1 Tax=Pararhizobium sp. BT-229 TaxID=2986923 RepID=UPI0021F75DB4|nr:hypothetical protein [Pararhizobium sp. BT-229]MCV9963913.1 hypothetical protein [Pararhizobium sp. BT-229]